MNNTSRTSVRTLVMLALLVAMSIVFSRVLSISTGFVRFNLGSLPVLLAALLFGPWAGFVPGPLHRVDVFHCLFVVHRYCLFMILNALRCALGILSGNIIFKFATPENLRIFRSCFFTGGVAAGNSISRTDPFS